MIDRSHDVVTPATGVRLSGNVTFDGDGFMSRYERVENDPLAGMGQLTGIQQLDVALKGFEEERALDPRSFHGRTQVHFCFELALQPSSLLQAFRDPVFLGDALRTML